MSCSPFFIIGNPRSGTSLLRLMLNSHPQITVPPECGFSHWLYNRYKSENILDKEVVNAFIDDVCASKKFETWGLDKTFILKYMANLTFTSYAQMATAIYQSYAAFNGKQPLLVGDKNNYYIKHLDELKNAFPDSKMIHIVRDGRDVACSYRNLSNKSVDSKYKPILPFDIKSIASEWTENNNEAIKKLSDASITVRYEDLLTSPHIELSRICCFLGIEFNEEMLSYYKKNDEPLEFMQWKSKTLESPDTSNIGKFKTELTPNEISDFELVAAHTLDYFNYVTVSI